MYSVEITNHLPTFLINRVNNWRKDFLTSDLELLHCLPLYNLCLLLFMSNLGLMSNVSAHIFYLLAKDWLLLKIWPEATYSTTTLLFMNFAVKKSDDLFNF